MNWWQLVLYLLAALVFLLACGLTLFRNPGEGQGGKWLDLDGESWFLTLLVIGSVGLFFWGKHV